MSGHGSFWSGRRGRVGLGSDGKLWFGTFGQARRVKFSHGEERSVTLGQSRRVGSS